MTDLITYVIGQLRGACWEEEAAAVEALVKERDDLGRKLNTARYGQPDFAWSIHEEAMADLRAKLEKAEVINGLLTVVAILNDPNDERFPEAVDLAERFSATLAEIKGGEP